MPCQKISNWTHIRQMCLPRSPPKSDEEVDIMATEIARQFAREEATAFERESEVAQQALAQVVEEAEKAVAKEATAAALREVCREAAVATLESVVPEAATIAVPQRGAGKRWRRWQRARRLPGKEEHHDMQCEDKFFLWSSSVSEGVQARNIINCTSYIGSKELPIVYKKISSSISDELIRFDPPDLHFPLLPNKKVSSSIKIVNLTDHNVGFHAYIRKENAARYPSEPGSGILPPRSTRKLIITREQKEDALQDKLFDDKYFVWNGIVSDGVEDSELINYMDDEESKKLPIILDEASPCTADELIIFDPPELSLPFIPNKPLLFSANIVNNTDYYVYYRRYHPESNIGVYYTQPGDGVLPPRSTQRLSVKRVPEKKEQHDMQCEDKFFQWSCLVTEGVQASDISSYWMSYEESKELPIVYRKTSLCRSDELIQLDPTQLLFPFSTNKSVSTVGLFKIVNVTDHSVGFNIPSRPHEDNLALYGTEPRSGILPPQTAQTIKVTRTLKENVTEDIQCKDKIFVWNGIVTEGVEVSYVDKQWKNGDKELPVVLTKAKEKKFWKWS